MWRRDNANHNEIIPDVTKYIVNFYNGRCLHLSLDYLCPYNYEIKMIAKQPIAVSEKVDHDS